MTDMAGLSRCSFGVIILLLSVSQLASCLPEQGTWVMQLTPENTIIAVTKSMYNGTEISVKLECNGQTTGDITVRWLLRWTPCAEEYIGLDLQKNRAEGYLNMPTADQVNFGYPMVHFQNSSQEYIFTCSEHGVFSLEGEKDQLWYKLPAVKLGDGSGGVNEEGAPKVAVTTPKPSDTKDKKSPKAGSKQKRAAGDEPKKSTAAVSKPAAAKTTSTTTTTTTVAPKATGTTTTKKSVLKPGNNIDHNALVSTWEDGVYLFVLNVEPKKKGAEMNVTATVHMKGPYGYLSAIEWPLLPFYGCMCVVYVIFGIIWLFLTFCNWRDLLRIQFWIGAVVFLGMLEKAVFFAEYESINATGRSVRGAVIFAELVSCLKRALARILVVIVSLGFGIVKPRLGPMLHRVLGTGALYFILSSVESCLRVLRSKGDPSKQALLASIPLAVLDAAICWWVFTSLVQTTRTLRLRRNVIKLSLYRHFTNTLIFAVLASVAFMIWSIKQHKLANCLTDWKELWVDEAFWHLLFSVILMVIMILWRPTINNQRYAFSPLLDAAEDDEDNEDAEPMLNDAFDGMKMRGKGQSNGSPKQKSKPEDDLKWIDENIPSSVTDAALPSLLDSDEEIMNTKFEMSKME